MDHNQVVLVARVALAAVLGFLIGWERHTHGSPAGDRTHALVAVGACSFTAAGVLNFPETTGQLIGGVVTSIGFLGAGLIFRQRTRGVHGLTSAAGLWVTCAVGVVVGIGYAFAAIGLTAIVLLLLVWDRVPILRWIGPPEDTSPDPDADPERSRRSRR